MLADRCPGASCGMYLRILFPRKAQLCCPDVFSSVAGPWQVTKGDKNRETSHSCRGRGRFELSLCFLTAASFEAKLELDTLHSWLGSNAAQLCNRASMASAFFAALLCSFRTHVCRPEAKLVMAVTNKGLTGLPEGC